MKIYTKTGDGGSTGLFGGERVGKDSPRIEAYGDVDELNAVIGMTIAAASYKPIQESLREVQNTLFTVGAQLASPSGNTRGEVVTAANVDALERQIDVLSQELPKLTCFILPGGGVTSAHLHLARTVCRRAERKVVRLNSHQSESVDSWLLIYLNRLSDFLFVLARLANKLESIDDIPWQGSQRSK